MNFGKKIKPGKLGILNSETTYQKISIKVSVQTSPLLRIFSKVLSMMFSRGFALLMASSYILASSS